MFEYEYNLSEWGCVGCLQGLIDASAMTNKDMDSASFDQPEFDLFVRFEVELSPGDKTILDGIIANDFIWKSWEQKRRSEVNAKTDIIILNDFVDDQSIPYNLDINHQMDYKASHDERTELTYPYTIKGTGSNYRQFADATEFHTWYMSAMGWVVTQIQTGWGIKDALAGLTLEQLKAWTDPRG